MRLSFKTFLMTLTTSMSLILATPTVRADDHPHHPAPAPAPAIEKIQFQLSEMKFSVVGAEQGAPIVLKAGQQYKLVFENIGQAMHEVLLGRGVITNDDDIEDGYSEELLGNQEVIVTGSSMINNEKRIFEVVTSGLHEIELDPGLRLSILFTLPESARGVWEIGCFAPGHHRMGMKLPVIVK